MTEEKKTRYPWGTETPGPRLTATRDRAAKGLKKVDQPGYKQITEHVNHAVKELRPLVQAMEFVARAGLLRPRARTDDTVQGAQVRDAVRAVHEALVALNASTALTLGANYEALAAAAETLIVLAKAGAEHGIAGTGENDPNDPWQPFDA